MAIGRNVQESMQKALRGLETGLDGFNRVPELEGVAKDVITAALNLRAAWRANGDPRGGTNPLLYGDQP